MTPTDLVVVLPGILGSTLRQHGRLVWAPSGGAILRAITTFGAAVTGLELPAGIGDERPNDGVEPDRLMPDLHALPGIWTPIKGYDKLLDRLRSLGYRENAPDAPPGNLFPVPYDWRLSNRYNGKRLGEIVEPALARWRAQGGRFADAKLTFVCHSMGGLVARWYIEHCGGADITGRLITFGTPYRGAANALEQLVNGARKGIGPLAIDLTRMARSMPSLHQLLPEYACIQNGRELAKTTESTLPELDTAMVADAMLFHRQLADAERARPDSLEMTHAIVGIQQSTATTARIVDGRVELDDTYQHEDLFGDGTVPIVAASRADVRMTSNTLRRVPDQHGNLQRNRAALDELTGILTARDTVVRGEDEVAIRVDAPRFVPAGDPLTITVTAVDGGRYPVRVTITDENGETADTRRPPPAATTTVVIDDLAPGAYSIDVTGLRFAVPISPVSMDTIVWPG